MILREGLIQNDANFPELKAKPSRSATAAFRPAPAPSSNPWGRNQPSMAAQEPPRESARRPAPPLLSVIVWRRYPNGDGRPPRGIKRGDLGLRQGPPSM
ncbi:hypothetical protein EVAR_80414_1 [Eumeta japonica]|uniref:Uncharacterized protein n=1 Tax=Eumeta variegata TaxID=151549 RepID=A0A4C1VI11_EUMVA|nr:hypothetical protein EVAR_80414_1 [Eumeta japonica]